MPTQSNKYQITTVLELSIWYNFVLQNKNCAYFKNVYEGIFVKNLNLTLSISSSTITIDSYGLKIKKEGIRCFFRKIIGGGPRHCKTFQGNGVLLIAFL